MAYCYRHSRSPELVAAHGFRLELSLHEHPGICHGSSAAHRLDEPLAPAGFHGAPQRWPSPDGRSGHRGSDGCRHRVSPPHKVIRSQAHNAPAAVDLSAAACSPTRRHSVAAPHTCGRHLAYAGITPTLPGGQTGSPGSHSPIPQAIGDPTDQRRYHIGRYLAVGTDGR
jgi:hypothetical protein